MKEKVDISTWNRKLAYTTFKDYTDPYTGIVAKLDVTNLVNLCKQNNLSFYGSMTYFVLKSMIGIDAFYFGYGKTGNEYSVYKYDNIAATVTVMDNNNELNFTRYIEYIDDLDKFMFNFSIAVKDASNGIPYYKIKNLENMNKVNITCIPWISFSNFKDANNSSEKSSKSKICWDKYYFNDNKYFIDVSLLVNHAFQDGYHMGLFFQNLQQEVYNIETDKRLKKVR